MPEIAREDADKFPAIFNGLSIPVECQIVIEPDRQ
jgi:hypothetical protein